MNILLIRAIEIADGEVTLSDHRAAHIRKVLRAEIGDRIRVGVINGARGEGIVTAIGRCAGGEVRLQLNLDQEPASPPEIDIILALPRPIMLRRILSQAAAIGVGSLFIIHANRVEKSFWDSGLFDGEACDDLLRQGLEQAVDTRMPDVQVFRRFKPFVEDILPEMIDSYRFRLLAHPYGGKGVADCLAAGAGRVLLAVGPEGGWVDYEVEKFNNLGFCTCSFGERILKVDTAVVALHSAISAIRTLLPRM